MAMKKKVSKKTSKRPRKMNLAEAMAATGPSYSSPIGPEPDFTVRDVDSGMMSELNASMAKLGTKEELDSKYLGAEPKPEAYGKWGNRIAGGLGALGVGTMLAQMLGGDQPYASPAPTEGVGMGEEEMLLRRMEMMLKAQGSDGMAPGELSGLIQGYEQELARASIPTPQKGARQIYAEMGLL